MNDPRTAWNRASAAYQARTEGGTDDIHYGPWAPPERDLGILGELQGVRVLDAGCGGGQNVVAMAHQGAQVIGLDVSDTQLAYAQRLAAAEGVDATFVHGTAEELPGIGPHTVDLILANYVFPYVDDIGRALAACSKVLVPGGRLVMVQDHPIVTCFVEPDDRERAIFPVRGYFDRRPAVWTFDGTDARIRSYHRTIGDWSALLAAAGLQIARLVEPEPPLDLLDELWPDDGALAPLRCLPQALVVVAVKGEEGPRRQRDRRLG